MAIGLAFAMPAPVLAHLPAAWPQAQSDLPADPAIRFGVLPNGMRYAIMRNRTPKDQVSIRFRFGVGSLNEADDQQGLAHLLEHMSFRGSTHVPESEVWAGLQRLGVAVGADASAYTQETQTFYLIDLPNAQPETIDFGLMRMRETASELTLDPEALDTERGPVLSEERLRDTPDLRALLGQRDFFYQGLLLPKRTPIGKMDIVKHADASQIRAFYQSFYRPDRATLIVVGDLDPGAVEARIKARFADWRAAAAAPPAPDLGAPAHRSLEARVVVDPKMSRSIQVGWVSPYDDARDTAPEARRQTIEAIALGIVNRRFRELADDSAPPFMEASLTRRNQSHSARLTLMSIDDSPRRWRSALHAAETVRRQATTFGVSQDEVDLEVSQYRARLETLAAGAGTRRTPVLAQAIMRSVDEGSVFTSPSENLALFNADVKGLTADEVTAALRNAFAGEGPLVFISSPIPVDGGERGVASALAQMDAETVSPPVEKAKVVWPYQDFGAPGVVAERRYVADLDATMVRFKNGVSLTIKPTRFTSDQVQVAVAIGHGLLDLPTDRSTARWAADSGAFISGGLGKLDLDSLQRALASKIYSIGYAVRDDHLELSGATRREDIETQMQVLAAYATDPGFRPEAFERVRSLATPLINNDNASPGGVMQRQLAFLLHDGDPRWASPTPIDIATAQPPDIRRLMTGLMGSGPIEVTIVGDVPVERAIAAAAATFGALPPRPADHLSTEAREVRFPAPQASPVVRRHAGHDDQAIFLVGWPVADARGDSQTPRDLRLLEQVIKSRLFNQFRVADGAAYEADTYLETSQTFPGYGYIIAFAEAPPDKERLFYDTIAKITADLRLNTVSADELERARQPRLELFAKAQQNNGYWLNGLVGASTDPHRLDLLRTTLPALRRVSADDVQRMAQTYLLDDHAWRFEVQPRTYASNASGPRATGIAKLDCGKTNADRLTDCRVVKESPPGMGVGATALTQAPNVKIDPKTPLPTQDGRIQLDLRVATPDPDP